MNEITDDTLEVVKFMQRIMYMPISQDMTGIGLKKDGEMVAGVLYEGYNGRNVWMHCAAVPTKRWMTKQYLQACFNYPFNVLKVDRVSAHVEEKNLAAHKLDLHIGFKPECRIKGADSDGGGGLDPWRP